MSPAVVPPAIASECPTDRPLFGVHVPQFRTGAAVMMRLAAAAEEEDFDSFWLMATSPPRARREWTRSRAGRC